MALSPEDRNDLKRLVSRLKRLDKKQVNYWTLSDVISFCDILQQFGKIIHDRQIVSEVQIYVDWLEKRYYYLNVTPHEILCTISYKKLDDGKCWMKHKSVGPISLMIIDENNDWRTPWLCYPPKDYTPAQIMSLIVYVFIEYINMLIGQPSKNIEVFFHREGK
ncbi:hypothetical protein QIT38_gp39 [Methanocaldococcus fervens tailed virus 1]|uniref:Uncharacterized protein n=2 Tax=root TaxID=1 RepID=C7P5K1_METFA|nr:hypothetical protein [Methanocaldococcus fervens]YP_010772334.1 hypothetical protein QIT38_gp39 [Methanocaldococcus fervens tailed virus 1]ACV25379.1 hypothetical protein Mefer_1576 [Methanocaldococcus fervens AG86]QNO11508.1 hypothetical protein [Methanocaldococcus fervens tailed virus 1]